MANGSSPTARALRTLEFLRDRPGTTAAQLAEALGVTERAARRYVEILREAGVPVESVRGPYGGYRVGRGTRLPPVTFTAEQALSLVMAVLDAGSPDPVVDEALGRVIRALPAGVGREAAALKAYAAIAPDPRAARTDPATASTLISAVAERRRVIVTYRGERGDRFEAEVDPWAVVTRYGRWYLLCHSHRADAIRTYRIDRIRDVRQTPHPFTPPEDLDPVRMLEENLGKGWRYPARVLFHAPFEQVSPWIRPTMGVLSPAGERCVLTGSTRNPAMYAQEWLAAIPFDFTVEAGTELHAAVGAVADRFRGAAGGARMVPADDGVPLRTWTSGTAGDRPPVLLLHGGPGLWDYLEPVARTLDPLTLVHRFDQRGCGGSGESAEHTFDRYLADVEALREHWGHDDWVVVGHSFGATLALEYATRHPDRTRALVYLSGVGIGDWRGPCRAETDRRTTAAQRERLAALEGSARSTREEVEFRTLAWFTDHADPVDGLRWAREDAEGGQPINWAANRALTAEADSRPAPGVAALTMPCWFVHGERDPRPAHTVAALAAAVPGARFEVIPGAGHHPWRERPARLRDLLAEVLAQAE